VEGQLVPLGTDPDAARALARDGVHARAADRDEEESLAREFDRRLRAGTLPGRLWVRNGRPIGLVVWEPREPLGLAVRLCFVGPEASSPPAYRELLGEVARTLGPIAFTGRISGLSVDDESAVMTGLGFSSFHRTEMRLPAATALPSPPSIDRISLRPLRATDLSAAAAVHERAYRDQFDRYLFFEDSDPRRDAERAVGSLIEGRWGEFLPGASRLAESADRPVGSTIVVRSEERALIADVAVDPAVQGRGIGRAILLSTLTALRARQEPVIALAVTEENLRAVRLYEGFGFVRVRGPERRWYHPSAIPVPAGGR
jgi:ribosomal protein S18 acetylase RimI-like enzyme